MAEAVKCTFAMWVKRTFGIGNFGGPPRRDGRQLRPPPPKSLAVGRGRRHNHYGFVDKWFNLLGLFREGSAPVRGVEWVYYIIKVIVGKCLVFVTKWKGLSSSIMKIVKLGKGFDDYGFVHAGVRELAAPGAAAPVRLPVQRYFLYCAQYSASVPPGACWLPPHLAGQVAPASGPLQVYSVGKWP